MSNPDGGIQVQRRGNYPNVEAYAEYGAEVSYAKIEQWGPCPCGQRTVTRRSDRSYGCVRCGRTRTP